MKAWLSESCHYWLLGDRLQSIHFSVSLSYRNQRPTTKCRGLQSETQQKWKLWVIRKSKNDTLSCAISKWIMIDELRRQCVKEFNTMLTPIKAIFAYWIRSSLHNDFKFNLPVARKRKALRNVREEVDMLLAVHQQIKQRVCQQLA